MSTVEEVVAESRRAQGLPPEVEDRATIERAARIAAASRRRSEREAA